MTHALEIGAAKWNWFMAPTSGACRGYNSTVTEDVRYVILVGVHRSTVSWRLSS